MKTLDALRSAMAEVDAYYKERGIFQDKFGFGTSPAMIVIDMAYGWTDPAYAGGSARLDSAIAAIQQLLPLARAKGIQSSTRRRRFHKRSSSRRLISLRDFENGISALAKLINA
jgi:hypothetical protein